MSFYMILLAAVGLAQDAFAVSISCGISDPGFALQNGFKCGIAFGFFQTAMTLLGYSLGLFFRGWIEPIDHWLAFFLLGFIGIKMIKESMGEEGTPLKLTGYKMLFALAVATSIDALAVGIGFSALYIKILMPSLLIGVISFLFSFCGVFLGKIVGEGRYSKYSNILGGLILIGIGFKILIEHLFLS